MRWLGRPARWTGLGALVSALLALAAPAARAGAITDYITIQPIDVCGSVCAPINNLGAGHNIWSNAPIGAVGFIDPSGVNVTRAIWNQIGIDVTYMPAVGYVNGSFLTLPVASCQPNGTDCASPQFMTLSQQAAISTGKVPNPTNPTGIPVSQNASTVNAFFAGGISPPSNQPGILYGLAWINNNGIAIASNSLLGNGARPDTLAHEVGHDLGLDHATFGAGGASNLMTAGNSRTIPSISAPLSTLGKTTDQLNTAQQNQALMSGFLNPIPQVMASATDPEGHNDFNVSFVTAGRPNEKLDTLTLTGPAGFSFDPQTTLFRLLSNPDGLTVDTSFAGCADSGCSSLVLDFTGGLPFVLGDSIDYSLCVVSLNLCSELPVDELAGGTYTYNFETDVGGVPVEMFQTTSELSGPGDLTSDSWDPDLMFPSQILNPTTFVGFSPEPCAPTAGSCPPLVLADAFPPEEDKLPEPPPLPPLAVGLTGLLIVIARRSCRGPRISFKARLAQPV